MYVSLQSKNNCKYNDPNNPEAEFYESQDTTLLTPQVLNIKKVTQELQLTQSHGF